jgi:hypothetical protein
MSSPVFTRAFVILSEAKNPGCRKNSQLWAKRRIPPKNSHALGESAGDCFNSLSQINLTPVGACIEAPPII